MTRRFTGAEILDIRTRHVATGTVRAPRATSPCRGHERIRLRPSHLGFQERDFRLKAKPGNPEGGDE